MLIFYLQLRCLRRPQQLQEQVFLILIIRLDFEIYIWYKCNWLKSILFLCFRINIYQNFLQMWLLKKSKLLMSPVLSSLPFILLAGFMMHDLYHNWLIKKFFYFDRIHFLTHSFNYSAWWFILNNQITIDLCLVLILDMPNMYD